MNRGFVIAIDGPVAAGKSTIAPILTRKLHGFYLWTGAMYRCVAIYCLENNIALSDEENVSHAAQEIAPAILFKNDSVFLFNKDVTKRLGEKDAAEGSSLVGVFPRVRAALVERQQAIAEGKMTKGEIIVAEGRDTGTKEFADAALKIFLTASSEIRAKRRMAQLEKRGESATFDSVLQDIRERDKRDSERETDPLVKEPEKYGYFIVNDNNQTRDETIAMIIDELKRRELC